jgi:chromosomal replication initiation ATPase DnaA
MKEIREEVDKGNKLLQKKSISPYIFAGLPQQERGTVNQISYRLDVETGDVNELDKILNVVTGETGYSASQLRKKTKGRIGLSTARQVFILLGMDRGITLSTVGRFINRDHTTVKYTNETVRERLNTRGYELLTTQYNHIKSKL